jgi:hypothetical protein
MAIKIAGSTVINNSFGVENMSSISGKYGQFHGNVTPITTVLDMLKPTMSVTLSADTTFTATNLAVGRACILLLNVSSSGHTPTFPSSVEWPGDGTAPDFDAAGIEIWVVGLTCWDSGKIRATATGWGDPPTASVDLGAQDRYYASSTIWDESTSPHGKMVASMTFEPSGAVTYSSAGGSSYGGFASSPTQTGTSSWGSGVTGSQYEVNFNFTQSLSGGASVTANAGNNTWLSLSAARTWTVETGTVGDTIGRLDGTVSIRNASTNSVLDTANQELTAMFFGAGVGNTCLTNDMLVFVQGQGLTRVYDLEVGDWIVDGNMRTDPDGKSALSIGQYTQVTAINKDHLREGYYTVDGWLEITNDHPMKIKGEWVTPPNYAGIKEYTSQDTDTVYIETTSGQFAVYKSDGHEHNQFGERILVSGNYAKGAYSGD